MGNGKTLVIAIILSLLTSSAVIFVSRKEFKGETGAPGPQGSPGPPGIGEILAHEWQGTSIRFQNPDGSWGQWVDLQGERGIGEIPAHEWQGTSIRFQNPDGSWGNWVDLRGEIGESIEGPPGPPGLQGPQGEGYVIGDRWRTVKKWDLDDLKSKRAQSFETNYDIGMLTWSFSSSYKAPRFTITIYKCREDGRPIYPAYAVFEISNPRESGEYWLFGAGNWEISVYVHRIQRLEIKVLQLVE